MRSFIIVVTRMYDVPVALKLVTGLSVVRAASFMVPWSWSCKGGSINVDRAVYSRHGSFDLSSIPMNKTVEIHMERTKVLPSL